MTIRLLAGDCRDVLADAPLFAEFPVTDPADERMADLFADDEYQRLLAAAPEVKRDAFRNSARYVNQEANQPNGLLPQAAAD